MYENYTFEYLIERLLERVKNIDSSIDTSEGSLIYHALAPEAWELAEVYITISTIYDNTFADTAPREELILRAKERGMQPKAATKAILKGVFNIDIPLGARFSLNELNYVSVEKIDTGIYKLECETPGTSGNKKFGELIPIEFVEGLENSNLTELLIPGEDEEGTEEFRHRYFNSFNSQAFGGNRADYIGKIKSIHGVGGIKIYRADTQDCNIKAIIINSEFGIPSPELISSVQESIDPTWDGDGVGMAPIGHVVNIQGVSGMSIDIAATVALEDGYVWDDVSGTINKAIDNYFLSLAKTWESTENLIVRIAQIESKILDVIGVLDITDTQLNGNIGNLMLENNQIPIRGTGNADN